MEIGNEKGNGKKVMQILKVYSAINTKSNRSTWKTEPN